MFKAIALVAVILSLGITLAWAAAPAPAVVTIEGLVTRTAPQTIHIEVLGQDFTSVDVAPDATITRDGVFVALSDLKFGDFARIRAENRNNHLVAIVIEATSKSF